LYTLPQEIEVWYIIPAIRRDLSKCFVQDFNMTYDKVGAILGISKAAVSQYLKNKRASKIKLHERVQKEAEKSCEVLVKKKSNAVKEINRILEFIRKNKLAIEVCDKSTESRFEKCKEIPYKIEN